MRWAFFLPLIFLSAVSAAEEPAPVPCQSRFAALNQSVKQLGSDLKSIPAGFKSIPSATKNFVKKAVAAEMELEENVIKEGPLRILVRKRTEEEKAIGYRSYFIAPKDESLEKPNIFQLGLSKLAKLNPVRRFTPTRGMIESMDRLFLGDRTTTNGIKGTAVLGAGLAASTVALSYTYDPAMSWLEHSISHRNAINEALAQEYEFRALREKIAKNEISARQARNIVDNEFKARAAYYGLFSKILEAKPEATLEEIGSFYLKPLFNPQLGNTVKDLRYYLGKNFSKNPMFKWDSAEPAKISRDTFGDLFSQNHIRLYGTSQIGNWIRPSFTPNSIQKSSERQVYDAIMADPFRQKLLSYQRAHLETVSPTELESWLSEDLEWATRFASLKIMGAQMRDKPGSESTVGLGDRRAYFLKKHNLPADLVDTK